MPLEDQEKRAELQKNLDEARKVLDHVSIDRTEEYGAGSQNSGQRRVEDRTYALEKGREEARKALGNCEKISTILREVDEKIADELDKDIKEAREELMDSEMSPVSLDEWYKSELVPLLNKSEMAVQDVVEGL
jgi:hypothetical protein